MRKMHLSLEKIKLTKSVDIIAGQSRWFAEISMLPTIDHCIAKESVALYEQNSTG